MGRRRSIVACSLLLIALPLLASCSRSDPVAAPALPDDAVITYAFHDSSVPPQYHRSVMLTVTRDEARIVVDSYGDVLADETAPTPVAVWNVLGDTMPTVSALTVTDVGDGCTGGTGIDLVVSSGSDALIDLAPQFCGGSNDALEDPINAWIAPARALFADTDVLAPEGE